MAQWAGSLPGVQGALSLIPRATQTGCGGVYCNLRQRRYRLGAQRFKVVLGHRQ